MGLAVTSDRKSARLARLYGATALACVLTCVLPALPASAQELPDIGADVPEGSQMLLEADTLVYDNDANTVTAVGGVQIDYGGNRLVAQRVTYDRKTSRLIASGNVEIVDSSGTRIFSDEIDITDDFADGFVNALRVETVDKTYFAAESAERKGGRLTTFNNGVYTACEPCEEKPDQAPIWRIKARKIIWDGKAKTVRFENSRFEFFGFPLAFLPSFEIADPTVKRKSGFLFPGIKYKSELGVGVSIPYYLALSPTYDLTLTGTGYTKQGFLGEAEWRQRFNNGEYSLKIAGIHQNDPDAFIDETGPNVDSGRPGDPNKFRGMFGTQGRFDINPRWVFGWDVLVQTDKNFSRTYEIEGYNDYVHRSEIYLTGLHDRNFFDLRGMYFQLQEDAFDSNSGSAAEKQPWVLPSFDYSYTPDAPVAGGELNIDINSRSVLRSKLDQVFPPSGTPDPKSTIVRGIEGDSARLTAEAEWKRSYITDGGLVVTPLLAFQADTTYVSQSDRSIKAINDMARDPDIGVAADIRSAYYRAMATAGLELRWPVLFSTTSATHVLEPMAQVFARPDARYEETLGIPNEDAQSFVFDASTLFERDKFSGYDRIEGGSRANLGLRYSGSFGNGWATNALFGQSYQLAGDNPFAAPDLVNAGAYSGLDTETSDYVGLAGFTAPNGLSASVSARFDEQTFEIRRAETKIGYFSAPLSLTAQYAFVQAQPLYGFSEDRREVTLAASSRVHENWRAFGSGTYDLEAGVLVRNSVGFAYDDECFSYTMTWSTKRDNDQVVSNREDDEHSIGFNISFRTLGDFGSTTSEIIEQ
ncbi:LPS-assembly protein LptD [Mesorhizobium camelthorni]|uniref:LPS-assembly protein LptD n=2 Tax=Allomesorhizobium camelthorni TaxID=475069 RepID=A0A6G4WE04_9HYPH|nr:LPS-assembly protein LptD [Mesorhizobium camelthorni]